jgi:selenocysteine lyase/cysteine desulfurase
VLTSDNHNSVNGLRMAAAERGARTHYVPLGADMRGVDPDSWLPPSTGPSLFAFPAQSNFSGVQHPLGWVSQAQGRGYRVLLDIAAYVSSSPFSLSQVPADFVALSYYKLFGFPTGVGALVCRREALAELRRHYFAGGTVQFVSTLNDMQRAREDGGAFEDGTPDFLAMPSVCDGLRWFADIGPAAIQRHVARLTSELLDRLSQFGDHIAIYGPRECDQRGGTVAFNVRSGGTELPYEPLEISARESGLAIRGSCFCNPGAAERAFNHSAERTRVCLQGEFSIPRLRACLDGPPVGALRVSVGVATTVGDLDRLTAWLGDVVSRS